MTLLQVGVSFFLVNGLCAPPPVGAGEFLAFDERARFFQNRFHAGNELRGGEWLGENFRRACVPCGENGALLGFRRDENDRQGIGQARRCGADLADDGKSVERRFEIVDMDGRKIDKLLVSEVRKPKVEAEGD